MRAALALVFLLLTMPLRPALAEVQRTNTAEFGVSPLPGIQGYSQIGLLLNWHKLYAKSLDDLQSLGVNRLLVAKSWSELEPREGDINTQSLVEIVDAAHARNMKVFFGLQIINTVTREVPKDLANERWNTARMQARVEHILSTTLPLMKHEGILYVSLGNEVDVYFRKHPEELADYLELSQNIASFLHKNHPNVRLGITTTFDALRKGEADIVRTLNQHTDVMMMTYYATGETGVLSPNAPAKDFPMMVAMAAKKPLLLQEVGYPSAEQAGSSEAKQAEFVDQVLAAWKQQQAAIPYINFFVESDFSDRYCDAFQKYYGMASYTLFKAQLCSLGLKDNTGKPKAAWKVLQSKNTEPTVH